MTPKPWICLVAMASAAMVLAVVPANAAPSVGATINGKLELPPPPELPPMSPQGFVARSENALQQPQPPPLAPLVFVVLEGTTAAPAPQVNWDLVGESFSHTVVAAMAGAEVVIKNASRTPRNLTCAEDSKLLGEVINPSGAKTIHVEKDKTYTIRVADAPYVWGRIIVTGTPYIGYIDATGKFEIPEVPEGSYTLRVYYKDGWLDVSQPVNIAAKAKTESVTVKVAALKTQAK
jgi:hypothetical protein